MPKDTDPRGPEKWGYKKCYRCGTWRVPENMVQSSGGTEYACKDTAWCGRQAGVGRGEMKADTGDGVHLS